jgi:hypothetical protein
MDEPLITPEDGSLVRGRASWTPRDEDIPDQCPEGEAQTAPISVAEAVDRFLDGEETKEAVLNSIARALAAQLDQACQTGTARGLSAVPPLTSRLIAVVEKISEQSEEEKYLAERRRNHERQRNWAARQAA